MAVMSILLLGASLLLWVRVVAVWNRGNFGFEGMVFLSLANGVWIDCCIGVVQ